LARCLGERRAGKRARRPPAPDSDERLEMRMLLLQELKLREVATPKTSIPFVAGIELVDGGIGIDQGALAVVDLRKRVIDVRQFLARDVWHIEFALIDAPLGEVGNDPPRFLGFLSLCRGGKKQSNRKQEAFCHD